MNVRWTPGESWNTLCICWPFVIHSFNKRYVYVGDKVPDGLDVYENKSGRRRNLHPTCETFTKRMLRVYVGYSSVRCHTLYVQNVEHVQHNSETPRCLYERMTTYTYGRTRAYTQISQYVGHTLAQYATLWSSLYTGHITNEVVRKIIKVHMQRYEYLLTIFKRRQLKWYDHVTWSDGGKGGC